MTEPVHDYPAMLTEAGHVEPVPRRVRAVLAGEVVLDTTRANYVWEWPYYPQYYIPVDDIASEFLVDEDQTQRLQFGTARHHGLRVGQRAQLSACRIYGVDAIEGVRGTARFEWGALDTWYEEDEQVFVHPRNPYVRVDALRSHRHVRIELDGTLLAESRSPVLVFETGLPTRYYLDRTDVAFAHLTPSPSRTACPYKGVTSAYWSARTGEGSHTDIAWAYDHPVGQLQPIAGMLAFYNEKVDIIVGGDRLPRPVTHLAR